MDKQDNPRTSETLSCFFPVTTSPQVQPFSWLQKEKGCFHCTLRDWHHTTYILFFFFWSGLFALNITPVGFINIFICTYKLFVVIAY